MGVNVSPRKRAVCQAAHENGGLGYGLPSNSHQRQRDGRGDHLHGNGSRAAWSISARTCWGCRWIIGLDGPGDDLGVDLDPGELEGANGDPDPVPQ